MDHQPGVAIFVKATNLLDGVCITSLALDQIDDFEFGESGYLPALRIFFYFVADDTAVKDEVGTGGKLFQRQWQHAGGSRRERSKDADYQAKKGKSMSHKNIQ